MNPDKSLLANTGQLYRMQIAVSPLLPREIPLVIDAFTKQWARPEVIEKANNLDAFVLIAAGEGHLRLGERLEEIARNITYAVWKTLDRYVKVTIEATYLGENPNGSFEFGEKAYSEAYGARFES